MNIHHHNFTAVLGLGGSETYINLSCEQKNGEYLRIYAEKDSRNYLINSCELPSNQTRGNLNSSPDSAAVVKLMRHIWVVCNVRE